MSITANRGRSRRKRDRFGTRRRTSGNGEVKRLNNLADIAADQGLVFHHKDWALAAGGNHDTPCDGKMLISVSNGVYCVAVPKLL
jgi:hypothetical protein